MKTGRFADHLTTCFFGEGKAERKIFLGMDCMNMAPSGGGLFVKLFSRELLKKRAKMQKMMDRHFRVFLL